MSLNPFKKQTVAAILADFTAKVQQLNTVATEQQAAADKADATIAKATSDKAAALAEKAYAEKVAAKIADLVA